MKAQPFFIFIVFLLLAATPASAEMYHWVDGAGISYYANSPPPADSKSESSWQEIHSRAVAGVAKTGENERVVNTLEPPDVTTMKTSEVKAMSAEARLAAKLSELKKEQAMLAAAILADRYNFHPKAKVVRHHLRRIDGSMAAAKALGKDVAQFEAQRQVVWDKLFTERYVIGAGRPLMERYQSVSKKIRDLK